MTLQAQSVIALLATEILNEKTECKEEPASYSFLHSVYNAALEIGVPFSAIASVDHKDVLNSEKYKSETLEELKKAMIALESLSGADICLDDYYREISLVSILYEYFLGKDNKGGLAKLEPIKKFLIPAPGRGISLANYLEGRHSFLDDLKDDFIIQIDRYWNAILLKNCQRYDLSGMQENKFNAMSLTLNSAELPCIERMIAFLHSQRDSLQVLSITEDFPKFISFESNHHPGLDVACSKLNVISEESKICLLKLYQSIASLPNLKVLTFPSWKKSVARDVLLSLKLSEQFNSGLYFIRIYYLWFKDLKDSVEYQELVERNVVTFYLIDGKEFSPNQLPNEGFPKYSFLSIALFPRSSPKSAASILIRPQ